MIMREVVVRADDGVQVALQQLEHHVQVVVLAWVWRQQDALDLHHICGQARQRARQGRRGQGWAER
jgi:hypothetical protein